MPAPSRRDQALAYIIERITRSGTSPSYVEIGRALDVSKTRARQLVEELIERGLIEKTPGAQRDLRVLDVRQCRILLEERLRAMGWIASDPMGRLQAFPQVQLPVLPPFEHISEIS